MFYPIALTLNNESGILHLITWGLGDIVATRKEQERLLLSKLEFIAEK